MELTQKELVQLWANNDKRREFLKHYKKWGVWLTVSELGLTYYKYELPETGSILAMEYQRENIYPQYSNGEKIQTITVYYLWDGEYFIPNPAGEFAIVDRLKNLKTAMQKELRANSQ